MAFVIEPGIYIREAALNELPKTAENLAFIEKVRGVVQKYKDIGVRIEDSFLLTDSGLENLSKTVPRTLEDVEKFMAAQGDSMKKALKIAAAVLVVAVVVGVPALVGIRPFIGPKARALTDRRFEPSPARVERGKYLVTSGRAPCALCHSPMDFSGGGLKVKDGAELSGRNWAVDGVPFVTAQNLTPDPETGIGNFTDDELARAIREGIGRDGRALFPIMPYPAMHAMPDEDLASIVVYLRSLKPIRNPLTPSAVPFPLNRLIAGVPATGRRTGHR